MNMDNLINDVIFNLVMVAHFLYPMVAARLSDIIFGGLIAWRSDTIVFSWRKIAKSIAVGILMLIGLALFVTSIVSLPEILEMYNITFIDTGTLSQLVDITVVVGLLVTTAITYGRDAYEKLLKLLGK